MVYPLSNTEFLHFAHRIVLTTKHRVWETVSVSVLRRKGQHTSTQFGESERANFSYWTTALRDPEW